MPERKRLGLAYKDFTDKQKSGSFQDENELRNLYQRLQKRDNTAGVLMDFGVLLSLGAIALSNVHLTPIDSQLSVTTTGLGVITALGGALTQGWAGEKLDDVRTYMKQHSMLSQKEQHESRISRYISKHPEHVTTPLIAGVCALVFSPLAHIPLSWETTGQAGLGGAAAGLIVGLALRGLNNVRNSRM